MTFETQEPLANPGDLTNILQKRAMEKAAGQRRKGNHHKFEEIFAMFGTDKARREFLELLERYYRKYRAQKYSDVSGYKESEKGRASLHEEIIDILQRLALTIRGGDKERILASLYDRDTFHQAVGDYFFEELAMNVPPDKN